MVSIVVDRRGYVGVPLAMPAAHNAFDFDAGLASGTPLLDTHHRLDWPNIEDH